MANVTIDALKERLGYFKDRLRELEAKNARQGGMLRRQETSEGAYFPYPYLIGATDERVEDRFGDIFINQTELTDQGKLGLFPITEEEGFMQKFCHLMLELGARGGMPIDLVARSRNPSSGISKTAVRSQTGYS